MKTLHTLFLLLLGGFVTLSAPGLLHAEDRAHRSVKKNDKDGDGRISRAEWRKRASVFKEIDSDGDGYLTVQELRARFAGGGGEAGQNAVQLEGQTSFAALDEETLCAIGRGLDCDIRLAVKRGMFETGLRPRFPEHLRCHGIDEQWAIDYTGKRDRVNYHGGIDMPASFGTSMIAAAAGTVVGRYEGKNSYRGMEIILRHSPQDTGIPLWIYTQYAHFDAMPKQQLGQRVAMGEVLGPTGNSGKAPSRRKPGRERRPAIHFAVWFSTSPHFVPVRGKIIPVDGQWMDPNALYRQVLPFNSKAMKALPEAEKQVPIPVKVEDGEVVPANTKLIWPYACYRR